MRVIGLDVLRSFAEVAYLENGLVRTGGRVTLLHPELEHFAQSLGADDHVVLEATGNTTAIVAALKSRAGRGIVANPLKVRLISEARIKTDKNDAAILAQLYASAFLPEVWTPDDATLALRRQGADDMRSPLAPHCRPAARDPFVVALFGGRRDAEIDVQLR